MQFIETKRQRAVLFLGSLGALALSWTHPARAETCGPDIEVPQEANYATYLTDLALSKNYTCDQVTSDYYWTRFDFRKAYWNDFGYADYCDHTLPLNRTYNAISMLSDIVGRNQWGDLSGSAGKWAFNYTAAMFEEEGDFRFYCTTGEGGYAVYSEANDYYAVSHKFAYDANPLARAAMLFHEAAHAGTGQGHNCGKLDKKWSYDGAFTYQVSFLIDVYWRMVTDHAPWPNPNDRLSKALYGNLRGAFTNPFTNPIYKTWAADAASMWMREGFCDRVPDAIRNFRNAYPSHPPFLR